MTIRELFESDAEHFKTLADTGFWGRQGAGCLVMAADTGRILISHRSAYVQEPDTWGTIGGAIDSQENPAEAARREVAEEMGYTGKILHMVPMLKFQAKKNGEVVFIYHNFLAVIEHEFRPRLDWESQDAQWFKFGEWPSPLHPGLKSLLADPASINILKKYSQQFSNSKKLEYS